MKWLGVFLFPPGRDGSPSQVTPRNLLSFPNNLPVPIYTSGWREALSELSVLPKNTTQCPRPGLDPGPLAPESSALTMRPPHLPQLELERGFIFPLIEFIVNIFEYSVLIFPLLWHAGRFCQDNCLMFW